ncbi:LLM class flavin-dependent oxidoreductase [Nonomuraea sp. CA-141351]|uniref:LLM class flavin-dependent oxidoreductase n=1 Tax=Nonomuraea sp. CA-141351 TaxID=3239996 RepID=UPI003D936E58
MTQTRFAVSLPQQVADGTFDPGAFRDYLRRAEELGFHSAWTRESVLAPSPLPMLSPMETMTYAAACTERLRIGCAVFISVVHSPLHLAKSISTLDQLSRGRLEVGFGLGSRDNLPNFGISPDGLVSRFTEGIELMKTCWTETKVAFDGRFWHVDAAMEPKPYQKPHPPVWIGGHKPAAIRRAVHHGDGFFGAGGSTTAAFAEQVRIVKDELAQAGRDPGSFGIAKRVYVSVGDEQRISGLLERMYGDASIAVEGPPETCVRGLREVIEAGADLVLLDSMFDEPEQLELLATQVLPELRGNEE